MTAGSGLSDEDAALVAGVRARHVRALAKTITLIESSRADHQARAQQVINALLPETGQRVRVGISGAPGVGKSTFIEALGLYLIGQGQRVAVLAVDPSSSVNGGSILGDKTRMERLSMTPHAYIRPSPAAGSLGGVAAHTREAMLVCEAAGFDVVIVETVGVGQSETAVAAMTDTFVLLQQAHGGDDLQAIKKGIVELADLMVFNKADLDRNATRLAMGQMRNALRLLRSASHGPAPVLAVSAASGEGIDAFWDAVLRHRKMLSASGRLTEKRRKQALDWMWTLIDMRLQKRFHNHSAVQAALPEQIAAVAAGFTTPAAAAAFLLDKL
ncbi:MAG TPA: methylmalonyl Co-A mutase-associated GTPase MeaB [Noviherbaspirillum sp.]|nr:methylmalonyl Co-A mutase-associated GTPase MeaB [Noviherbaspirillum sp.]